MRSTPGTRVTGGSAAPVRRSTSVTNPCVGAKAITPTGPAGNAGLGVASVVSGSTPSMVGLGRGATPMTPTPPGRTGTV